jgi:hypothetical protein
MTPSLQVGKNCAAMVRGTNRPTVRLVRCRSGASTAATPSAPPLVGGARAGATDSRWPERQPSTKRPTVRRFHAQVAQPRTRKRPLSRVPARLEALDPPREWACGRARSLQSPAPNENRLSVGPSTDAGTLARARPCWPEKRGERERASTDAVILDRRLCAVNRRGSPPGGGRRYTVGQSSVCSSDSLDPLPRRGCRFGVAAQAQRQRGRLALP